MYFFILWAFSLPNITISRCWCMKLTSQSQHINADWIQKYTLRCLSVDNCARIDRETAVACAVGGAWNFTAVENFEGSFDSGPIDLLRRSFAVWCQSGTRTERLPQRPALLTFRDSPAEMQHRCNEERGPWQDIKSSRRPCGRVGERDDTCKKERVHHNILPSAVLSPARRCSATVLTLQLKYLCLAWPLFSLLRDQ